jgi:hypothetical protein
VKSAIEESKLREKEDCSIPGEEAMDKHRWIPRWSRYLVILYVAGALSAVAHEGGHVLALKALGYHPQIKFSAGRVENHDAKGNIDPDLPPTERIISSAGEPAMTLLLAVSFTALYLRHRGSFLSFAFAIMNSVFRLNMLIDGFNSDEGNISELLLKLLGNQGAFLVPLSEWTLFLALSCLLVRRQEFFRRTYWLILLFFLICAVSMISSFKILGYVFG